MENPAGPGASRDSAQLLMWSLNSWYRSNQQTPNARRKQRRSRHAHQGYQVGSNHRYQIHLILCSAGDNKTFVIIHTRPPSHANIWNTYFIRWYPVALIVFIYIHALVQSFKLHVVVMISLQSICTVSVFCNKHVLLYICICIQP